MTVFLADWFFIFVGHSYDKQLATDFIILPIQRPPILELKPKWSARF